jgi:hypothetical protein
MLLPDFYIIENMRIHNVKNVFEIQISKTPSNFDLYPGNIGELSNNYNLPLNDELELEFQKYKVEKWYSNQLDSYHHKKHIFNHITGWVCEIDRQKFEEHLKKHTTLPILDVFVESKAIRRI